MHDDELAAWLRLSLTPGVGNTAARRLLAALGLPQAVFGASASALEQLVSSAQAAALGTLPPGFEAQLAATQAWLSGAPSAGSRRVLTWADAHYPAALLRMEDPPLVLYVMGPAAAVIPEASLAIVGSRNPTPQGAANARQFSRALAQAGLTVVSGLALGIDAAAHAGALEGALPGQVATVAVVGTGLDRVYPRQHLELAHQIAERGLLVSEYPLGTPPLAANFPKRNRIIAALGQGTLVVEAALKSGSLITARVAAEQGKEVFAIPGSIHSVQSHGCHALLKQGAKLVETAQDILEELPVGTWAVGAGVLPQPTAAEPAAAPAEDSVLQALGFDPTGLDALSARTGWDAAALQAHLLQLELQGHVGRLPGGLFQRVAQV